MRVTLEGDGDTRLSIDADKEEYTAYWDSSLSPTDLAYLCLNRLSVAHSAQTILYLWSVGRNQVTTAGQLIQLLEDDEARFVDDCAFLRVDINDALSVSWQALDRGKGFDSYPPASDAIRPVFAYSSTLYDPAFAGDLFRDTAAQPLLKLDYEFREQIEALTQHLPRGSAI